MTPPEQALAARLTASELANQLFEILVTKANRSLREDWADHLLPLCAHVETLTQQVAEADAVGYHRGVVFANEERGELRQENARLTAEAKVYGDAVAEWRPIVERAAQAEQARDTALAKMATMIEPLTKSDDPEIAIAVSVTPDYVLMTRETWEAEAKMHHQWRTDRDAAHAALRRFGQHEGYCGTKESWKPYAERTCTCGLDAALAASAPQKEAK